MHIRKNKKTEILAPAGSVTALQAAVMAGCDAVYIGGSRFGARAYAENPDEAELLAAIDYAHTYGVKVYLTVNTLVKEAELSELPAYLEPYYTHGIDAVIVQDFGVMRLLSELWPDLPLHASTQMTLTNPEACRLLPKSVTRIVPARELELSELRRLREETPLELEVFCHGALCYSYSGQCLMSSLIGGRSGNRGRCAQPCRKSYVCRTEGRPEQRGYFLSPKDQCMLARLPELLALGVDSLKIEGRMKNPLYAAGVTAIYRKWISRLEVSGADAYRKEEREELNEDIRKLAELYSRGGFSEGYPFSETGREMISLARPNHGGVLVGIGRMLAGGKRCQVEYRRPVGAGDIFEIRTTEGTEERILAEYTAGARENEETRTVYLSDRGTVFKGATLLGKEASGELLVYRMKNDGLLAQIERECRPGTRKTALAARFLARTGEPTELRLSGKVSVVVRGAAAEPARKAPAAEADVREKLRKTGDTPYRFEPLSVELAGECFLPVSQLNELRRRALEEYTEALLASYRRTLPQGEAALPGGEAPGTGAEAFPISSEEDVPLAVTVMTLEQLRKVKKHPAVSRIYVDMEGEWQACLREGAERPLWLALPRITQGERLENLRITLVELSEKRSFDGLLVRSLDALAMLKTLPFSVPLAADANLYAMNSQAARWLLSQGFSRLTAPFEENERELGWLSGLPFELVIYGRGVAMVSRQCVWKTAYGCTPKNGRQLVLQDERGAEFPVQTCCAGCYNRIYNSAPLSLLPYLEQGKRLRPSALRMEFTLEKGDEVLRLLEAYARPSGGGNAEGAAQQEETRGHFRRGVL